MQLKHGSVGASATLDTSQFGSCSHRRHETLPKGESNFRLCPNRRTVKYQLWSGVRDRLLDQWTTDQCSIEKILSAREQPRSGHAR